MRLSSAPLSVIVVAAAAATIIAHSESPTGSSARQLASADAPKRRLRWYIGNVPRVHDFLLGGPGSNAHHWLNTSLDLGAPVTDGVYQCCHGINIQANGSLLGFPFNASQAPWDVTAFAQAGISMYYTITPGAKDPGAVTKAALARADAFALELLNLTLAYGLTGVHTDWEYANDNDLPSWIALWGRVKSILSAHGKQIVMSVDDSAPNKESAKDKSWSYLSHWDMFVNVSDVLINMGGYPLSNHNESYPAAEKLKPYRCGNADRWCGIEGMVEDMIAHGVDPSFQLQPGISPDGCTNGTTTSGGWTQLALAEYLDFLDTKGVTHLTVWTSDAFLLPATTFTCPWFMPLLRNWTAR